MFPQKISKAPNFITKVTLTQMFSCEFCEIFQSNFFAEYFRVTAFELPKKK